MAEIVNLRAARKARARSDREAKAEANRRKFGRTKAEKQADAAEKDRAGRALDAHKREP